MKKTTSLIVLLFGILMLTFSACIPLDKEEPSQNTSSVQGTESTVIQDNTSTNQNSQTEHQDPPRLIQLTSKEEFEQLYNAMTLDSEKLEEFLDKNHYSVNGIKNKEELQEFWGKTLNVPLPNLSKNTDVSDCYLQYYSDTSEYILWYKLGGRQYRYSYKEGPLSSGKTDTVPVLTGELHGTPIALRELGEGHAWEYGAEFRIDQYNVTLWVRNAAGISTPGPLSLEFSEEPWVTVDEAKNATFHLGT